MEKMKLKYLKNNELNQKAHHLIPGGAHTYSKGDDQFPENAPKIIDRGEGCYLWDVDNNKFLDFGMSLGTVILGHAYPPVLDAVKRELIRGVNFVRPSIIEGELAELMTQIIPSAEMVKFGKNGSDATTASVRLARAYTGRKYIVRCEDDPFNSIHDWFIGSTVIKSGVPEEVSNLTLQFKYNDLASLRKLFEEHPGQIAGVLLEPVSMVEPQEGFLEGIKDLCEKEGAILIFDEVVSGFRFALGGGQEKFNVTPHLSCFGKGMANGFSVSALAGKREIMELGGLHHDRERVFLLSTTHGGETHSIAAAIATIKEIMEKNLMQHYYHVGNSLMEGVREIAAEVGAEKYIKTFGYGCKPGVAFTDGDGNMTMEARSLGMQECISRGLLMPYIVPSYAHKNEHIKQAVEIIGDALKVVKDAYEKNAVSDYLVGAATKPVFRKFN